MLQSPEQVYEFWHDVRNLAAGGRGSEIRVELQYDPPGGRLGAKLANLFGEAPAQQVASDLHSDASIHRGMHPAWPAAVDEMGKLSR